MVCVVCCVSFGVLCLVFVDDDVVVALGVVCKGCALRVACCLLVVACWSWFPVCGVLVLLLMWM